ncbi:MAG: hypothetical protein ACI9F9_003128, partial [Candidatus Paceibacteria bacterium]
MAAGLLLLGPSATAPARPALAGVEPFGQVVGSADQLAKSLTQLAAAREAHAERDLTATRTELAESWDSFALARDELRTEPRGIHHAADIAVLAKLANDFELAASIWKWIIEVSPANTQLESKQVLQAQVNLSAMLGKLGDNRGSLALARKTLAGFGEHYSASHP